MHRRRATRRGKGTRQGTDLFLPRRFRPVGPEEPAPGAVEPLQRARAQRRARAGVSAQQLARARHLAVHRARAACRAGNLSGARQASRASRRPARRGDVAHPTARARDRRRNLRALPHGGRYHLYRTGRIKRSDPRGDHRRDRRDDDHRTWRDAARRSDARSVDGAPEARGLLLMSARDAFQTLDHGVLRFLTAGSVDDGKSTLIGRLLYDTKTVLADQLVAIERTSRRRGQVLDLSLLTDGLVAEREQGITIDVAYRYFATPSRKFIVADAPGHEQYTRNMVTAASTAQLAILLVDARQGIVTQTRRHATLASLLGISHIVVAVNKMDLVDYRAETFAGIVADFLTFAEP